MILKKVSLNQSQNLPAPRVFFFFNLKISMISLAYALLMVSDTNRKVYVLLHQLSYLPMLFKNVHFPTLCIITALFKKSSEQILHISFISVFLVFISCLNFQSFFSDCKFFIYLCNFSELITNICNSISIGLSIRPSKALHFQESLFVSLIVLPLHR